MLRSWLRRVPRPVRLLALHPVQSVRAVRHDAAARMGLAARVPMREGWTGRQGRFLERLVSLGYRTFAIAGASVDASTAAALDVARLICRA